MPASMPRAVYSAGERSRRGALALEYLVSHNEQIGLNPQGINVSRLDGNLKSGRAHTGGKNNGEFMYINAPIVQFLRESIDEARSSWSSSRTRNRFGRKLSAASLRFTNVWRDGAVRRYAGTSLLCQMR
jgi:hypothetical protein